MVYSTNHVEFIDESEIESTISLPERPQVNRFRDVGTENWRGTKGKARKSKVFICQSVSIGASFDAWKTYIEDPCLVRT